MEESYSTAQYHINPLIVAQLLTEQIYPKGTEESPYKAGTFSILAAAVLNMDEFYADEAETWNSLMTIFGFLSKPSLERVTLGTFADRGLSILRGKYNRIKETYPEAACVPYYMRFFSMSQEKQEKIIRAIQLTLLHLTSDIHIIVSKDVKFKEL